MDQPNKIEKNYFNGELVSEKQIFETHASNDKKAIRVFGIKSDVWEIIIKLTGIASIIFAGCQLYYDRKDKGLEFERQLKEDKLKQDQQYNDNISQTKAELRADFKLKLDEIRLLSNTSQASKEYLQRDRQFIESFKQQLALIQSEHQERQKEKLNDKRFSIYLDALKSLSAIEQQIEGGKTSNENLEHLLYSISNLFFIGDDNHASSLQDIYDLATFALGYIDLKNKLEQIDRRYQSFTTDISAARKLSPDIYLDSIFNILYNARQLVEDKIIRPEKTSNIRFSLVIGKIIEEVEDRLINNVKPENFQQPLQNNKPDSALTPQIIDEKSANYILKLRRTEHNDFGVPGLYVEKGISLQNVEWQYSRFFEKQLLLKVPIALLTEVISICKNSIEDQNLQFIKSLKK